MAGDTAEETLDRLWIVKTYEEASNAYSIFTSRPFTLYNFVDGTFQTSLRAPIDSFNPQMGRLFARVPNSSTSEVNEAVKAAHKAFKSWSKTSKTHRSSILKRIADLIAEKRDTLAAWESLDQGKTFARAQIEIDRAESNFRYFASYVLHDENAARFTDPGNVLTYEHRSPLGVFALISPWNMPLYLLTWKIAPCLAFGCTAVAKPSELTSVTAFLLADICRQAGLPAGVLNIIFGAGLPTGSAMVKHDLVKGISFTGGTATGRQIRRDIVHDIHKHLSLELGGKNPTLVFADADMEAAIKTAAAAAFENQGEICLCGSRIYVEKSAYEAFVCLYVAYVAEHYQLGGKVGAVVSLQHYGKHHINNHTADMASQNSAPVFLPSGSAQGLANYPHARIVPARTQTIYVSGTSSRRGDGTWEGVKENADGTFQLDVNEQTAAVLRNIDTIINAATNGYGSIADVVDATVFLVNMKDDYSGMNAEWNKVWPDRANAPARTTVEVRALPNPRLLVEIKCTAVVKV
ncbi:hypothetical protein AC579_9935 [Pseudocercospora musae]|uniref:Aldehyde dehydrogenase domain-containing protein n=1 Tax=Pseudocercospora musae TaxID=113226 RepID=A0A139I0T5_9PEZI|nr:hypothetical protein AC579_9935 [Pseudocercospora musae]